ncbi:MAG: extracellular solute-binding protein [Chloroflexi bacterium]|nr:extracellular solute-binding protein [Ardenticatenaceae bacterium]MBL1128784.1 extracellular solute-binding protein [Chloroflexota bacterium]NOG34862.1 extracellular solute-binding protein [Chloroflexota bacterium]GIK58850.1 MAG: sugar ABC transporter substrate-binding protein [Chloroflexota bacterium]
MRTSRFLLILLALILGMALVACGGTATEEPASSTTDQTAEEAAPAATTAPAEEAAPAATTAPSTSSSSKVQIRWFVGLGTGTNPEQIAVQEEVVKDFNDSQDKIELVLEIVPYDAARDTLATQIASGNGPDIIGPVGWGGSNAFYGQWLDIGPLIESSGFDTSIFDPALIEFYQTEEGQVGLPFAVFPGAMYFVPSMFDESGLAYPPQVYGEKYELDGEMVDWNWDTVTEVAKRLTIDVNGNNATEEGFDATQIVQLGYSPQWQHPNSTATFYGGAAKIYEGEAKGSYISAIPDSWKEAWRWWHEGMWGEQPFIASGPLAGSPEFGGGNVFNSGKAAMGLTQTWYTCCLGEFRDAGNEFQLGIQPAMANGVVQGRIDADTFRIWKGTQNPNEAFTVLAYLITTGGDKLLPIYGAMPAIADKTEAFFEVKSNDYPFVTPESWDVFVQGLAYPDTPSAEQYLPNWNEAFARIQTFGDLLQNTKDLDFDAEFQKLQDDLTVIYNK